MLSASIPYSCYRVQKGFLTCFNVSMGLYLNLAFSGNWLVKNVVDCLDRTGDSLKSWIDNILYDGNVKR